MKKRYEPGKEEIKKGNAAIKASKHPKKKAKELNEKLSNKRGKNNGNIKS